MEGERPVNDICHEEEIAYPYLQTETLGRRWIHRAIQVRSVMAGRHLNRYASLRVLEAQEMVHRWCPFVDQGVEYESGELSLAPLGKRSLGFGHEVLRDLFGVISRTTGLHHFGPHYLRDPGHSVLSRSARLSATLWKTLIPGGRALRRQARRSRHRVSANRATSLAG